MFCVTLEMCKKCIIVKGDYSGTNYNNFLLISVYLFLRIGWRGRVCFSCVSLGLEILCPHAVDFRDFLYLRFNSIG